MKKTRFAVAEIETKKIMEVIKRSAFETMPWPNGLGVAHEICRLDYNGKPAWRISLADVVEDCVFSAFEGMKRSTTVVSGAGMNLTHATGVIELRPEIPVTWDGALLLTGALLDGTVENFNVVWDPKRFRVDVRVETLPLSLPIFLADELLAFVLEGKIESRNLTVQVGDFVRGLFGTVEGEGKVVLIRVGSTKKRRKPPKTG